MLGLGSTFPAVDGAVSAVVASLESSKFIPWVVSGELGMIPVSSRFATDGPICHFKS